MDIKIGENYYYVLDLSEFVFKEAPTGEPIWVHEEDGDLDIYSYDHMQGFADSAMLMTQQNFKNFCKEQGKHAGKLVGSKIESMFDNYCYMKTALEEEYYFKLENIDMEQCMFIASAIAYKHPKKQELTVEEGLSVFTYVFAEELRLMTGIEIEDIFGPVQQDTALSLFSKIEPTMDVSLTNSLAGPELRRKPIDTIKLPKNYDPSLVNASIAPEVLTKKIKIALGKEDKPDCISMILSGPPGLGKSLAAKFVANELDKECHIKPLAELVDKWVGATEKNIQGAFTDAEEAGAVLVIDEVDAISGDRDESGRNHQISMVNSLLQALDSYNGIVIFTTNSTKRMDPAVLRRCLLEIEFKHLTSKQADAFAKMMFPTYKIIGLSENKFAPSDFSKTKDGLLFVDDKDINKKFIVEQIKKSAKSRTKTTKRHSMFDKVKYTGPVGFRTITKKGKQ